jgi:hypothetical protein
VSLEWGPLSLVSTIVEVLERKSSSSGLEKRDYGCRIHRADYVTPLYPQKVGTNFSDKRQLLGIVRSQTKATELLLLQFSILACHSKVQQV